MLATLLIAADLAGSLAVSDRTEARTRVPGTEPAAASLDLETVPVVQLLLWSPRFRYTLTYAPVLTLWDVGAASVRPTWLHAGLARVDWQSHQSFLSFEEAGSYGGVNFASLSLVPGAEGAPPSANVVPVARVIDFESSTTTLTSKWARDRWTVNSSTGYQLAGGADAYARSVLPFEAGPFARGSAEYAGSRRDYASTVVTASETSFSPGSTEIVLVEVDEGFRHLFSRVTEARLALGFGEARVRASAFSSYTFETHPVVEAVLEHHPTTGKSINVRLGARVGPAVNRLVGVVEERVEGSIVASHTYQQFTTHAFASAMQAVPTSNPYATSLLASELGTAYGATDLVVFDAGVRGLWQRQGLPPAAFLQGVFFLGITLRAPKVRR
jgi:hypothetical protein